MSDLNLHLCGDGQHDSPGFPAKYVTYSIMNLAMNKTLDKVVGENPL